MGEWRGCACGEGFCRERLQPRMTGERLAGYLNALSDERARAALQRCCGARRWVDAMLAARPFARDAELLATAERVWWELGRPDWLEAFAARSEEHTSELQSQSNLVCRLLLEKKKKLPGRDPGHPCLGESVPDTRRHSDSGSCRP